MIYLKHLLCPFLLTMLDLVLCRIFTEHEDPEGYFLLFSRVFKVIEEVTGKPLQFNYLHGSGVQAILADMDWSQMKGMSNSSPPYNKESYSSQMFINYSTIAYKTLLDRSWPLPLFD